jgi:hypothetical protein
MGSAFWAVYCSILILPLIELVTGPSLRLSGAIGAGKGCQCTPLYLQGLHALRAFVCLFPNCRREDTCLPTCQFVTHGNTTRASLENYWHWTMFFCLEYLDMPCAPAVQGGLSSASLMSFLFSSVLSFFHFRVVVFLQWKWPEWKFLWKLWEEKATGW